MDDFQFPEIDPVVVAEFLEKLKKEQDNKFLYQEIPFHPCSCPNCCNPTY